MEIEHNNKKITLQKKDRHVGSEAPAIRLKMANGETKVIGMMAAKVQVIITLHSNKDFDNELLSVIKKHQNSSHIYIICPENIDKIVNNDNFSVEFKDLALKMGVYIDDTICAKSVFIINKEGEIVYKQITNTLNEQFDYKIFDLELDKAIKFKQKGHTHENWMG